MKPLLIILAAIPITLMLLMLVLSVLSRSGSAPGLIAGRLSPCPDRPNCVCSELTADAAASIEPLPLPSTMDSADVMSLVGEIINAMGGKIKTAEQNYIASTFNSAVFGFVDDLELRIASDEGVIHIRSASRIGYSDAGVNKQRVERFRTRFFDAVRATD